MPAWTPARQAKVRRKKDGRFKPWPGGKADNRDSSFKGNHIHLTAEFKRQTGRTPKVGDTHIHLNKDGKPHGQAMYYIRTPNGWRRSKTGKRKPTSQQVKSQCKSSRPS